MYKFDQTGIAVAVSNGCIFKYYAEFFSSYRIFVDELVSEKTPNLMKNTVPWSKGDKFIPDKNVKTCFFARKSRFIRQKARNTYQSIQIKENKITEKKRWEKPSAGAGFESPWRNGRTRALMEWNLRLLNWELCGMSWFARTIAGERRIVS